MEELEEKMDQQDLLHFKKIHTASDAKSVLEAKLSNNTEEIQKLTFASSSEDTNKRLMLIGQRELLIKLLSRFELPKNR